MHKPKWKFDNIRGGRAYGPYLRKDGRKHIVVVYALPDGTYSRASAKETVSYPKWLMEQQLKRILDPNTETVDHKDRNFRNDTTTNLQLLPRPIHASLDVLRLKSIYVICVWCGKQFKLRALNRGKINRNKAGPFCSPVCVGQYGNAIQQHKVKRLPAMKKINKIYYLQAK